MSDSLGDRMKEYERAETGRVFMPMLPVYARIDGRGFSKFTRGMRRPYDERMSAAMVEATRYLVEHTHARIGYTQSDEISLLWLADTPKSDIFFAGKAQKMVSVLASMATAAFTRAVLLLDDPEFVAYASRMPHFDARAFSLPSKEEAANVILWREQDATKNAVSMAASHYYSNRELHGKSGAEKQEMLFAKGVNFNDYPASFKRGVYLRREVFDRIMTAEELARIPEKHRPAPDEPVTRSEVRVLQLPRLGSISNRVEVLFDGAAPVQPWWRTTMTDEELGKRLREVMSRYVSGMSENAYGEGVFTIKAHPGYEEKLRTVLKAAMESKDGPWVFKPR